MIMTVCVVSLIHRHLTYIHPSHRHRHHPLSMQVCKSEDFLQLGEEDVREMLRDEEVTPHCCC